MGTTGYNAAAIETTSVVVSYGLEAVWGEPPATTFQALRMTSESMSGKKKRDRPDEINDSAQVSAAVTTQDSADGALNFAFSYGTYDDVIGALLNAPWGASLSITGVGGDITFAATGNQINSATSGKFTAVQVGQYIKVAGCAASSGSNNGWMKVAAKIDAQTLTISGKTLVNETPTGAACTIRGSMIRNSNIMQTLFIQKKLGAAGFLTYGGSFVSGGNLNAQQGQFTQGAFNFISKSEEKSASDRSTGGVLSAPTGSVIDPVAGMQAITVGGVPIAATVESLNLQFQKQAAAAFYGLGSTSAAGITMGKLDVSGTTTLYFADFAFYDRFKSEAKDPLSYRQIDEVGSGYVLTLLNAALMNPKIVAGGPGRPVTAQFDIEGNPDPVTGATFQMDRAA